MPRDGEVGVVAGAEHEEPGAHGERPRRQHVQGTARHLRAERGERAAGRSGSAGRGGLARHGGLGRLRHLVRRGHGSTRRSARRPVSR